MVGLERTVLPLLAEAEFGLASTTAAVSFIAVFGATKALTNLAAGFLGDRFGRRRLLLVGWLFGIPVPLLVMWAPTWSWIVFANLLLGINQGLTWSTTVIMKIDLVGPRQRGLAMGLNEFAGYVAVALAALATGYIAERYGLRPEPFYLGVACAAAGLALSLLFVRETRHHADVEARASLEQNAAPTFGQLFKLVSWRSRPLFSANQAGLINNLNDGLAWGVFPLFFAAGGLSLTEIGVVSFLYPAVWGILQVWTGALSDRRGRKPLIAAGMLLQGVALFVIAATRGFRPWAAAAALLGLGTAMVYPTLLATVGDVAHPSWRGSAVGIYRLWRDSGYVFGAVLAGLLSDHIGMARTIAAVGALTVLSGVQVAWRMPETRTAERSSHDRLAGSEWSKDSP